MFHSFRYVCPIKLSIIVSYKCWILYLYRLNPERIGGDFKQEVQVREIYSFVGEMNRLLTKHSLYAFIDGD